MANKQPGKRLSILGWLVILYAFCMAVWLLLRLILFDQFWPLALVNTAAEYLFVPLPILIILIIWKRRWRLFLPLSIPIIIFVALFGRLFLPSFASTEENESTITAMSFNVLYTNKTYDAIADSVNAASPDLAGFQELTQPNAAQIINLLKDEYPHHAFQPKDGASVGLLSRYPIESVDNFSLPPMDLALHAIVNIDGESVHVFVVHLSPNNLFNHPISEFVSLARERYGRRAAEFARLKEEISGLEEPVLLMCDCNLTDTSEVYAHLDTFLDDSFQEIGWGFGHTFLPPQAPFPIQRIDYVWHSADFLVTEAFVGQDGASDHLPIIAKLRRID